MARIIDAIGLYRSKTIQPRPEVCIVHHRMKCRRTREFGFIRTLGDSILSVSSCSALERFPAKRIPLRVAKSGQNKNVERFPIQPDRKPL